MEIEGRTIILSTPEELLPLITQSVRTAEQGKTADAPDLPGKKLLAPKMWKENSAFTRRHSPTGIWKASVRYIRTSAGVSFMSAPYWKSILHPGVSKPRNQSSDGLLRPAYPR